MMRELVKHDVMNQRLFMAICTVFGVPNSYLDVGCGTGIMVKTAVNLGIDAVGLDIIPNAHFAVKECDLRGGFNLGKQFDLITCIEVMEHIPESSARTALKAIANHARDSGTIFVFSAASPGQGGIDHINLKLGYWWRERIDALGFGYRHDLTTRLQLAINLVPHPGRDWLIGNLQVFNT